MTDLEVMCATLSDQDALARVRALAGPDEARIEQRVFYPFFHFRASGRLRWLFGERHMRIDCVVDARTGRAASADALKLEPISAAPAEQLPVAQCVSTAERNARRYASHALGRGFRVLGNFNLELDPAVLVHRPYWIVRTSSLRVLVDAVTGDLHPLAKPGQEPLAENFAGADAAPLG